MKKRFDGPAKLNMVAAVNLVLYDSRIKAAFTVGSLVATLIIKVA